MTDRRMNKDPMQITERELHTMTVELEEMHQATLPVFRESLNDFGATLRELQFTAEPGATSAMIVLEVRT